MRNILSNVLKLRALFDRSDRRFIVVVMGLMLVGGALEALGIAVIQGYLALVLGTGVGDRLSSAASTVVGPFDPAAPPVLLLSAILLGFFFVKNVFLVALAYLQARLLTRMKSKISDRLFRLYQFAPYGRHLKSTSADLIRTVQHDVQQCVQQGLRPLLELVLAVIMTVGIAAVLIAQAPAPAVVALALTALGLAAVTITLHRALRRASMTTRRAASDIMALVQNGHGAFVDARLTKSEEYLARHHARHQDRYARADTLRIAAQRAVPYVSETLAMLGLMGIVYIVLAASPTVVDAMPVIGVVLVATMRLRQLSGRIANSVNSFSSGSASVKGVLSEIDALRATSPAPNAVRRRGAPGRIEARIVLQNVGFQYGRMGPAVVEDVSLTIEPGQSVAFVGPTGSGKSTLLALLLGLMPPTSGRITVAGRPLREVTDAWQDEIGYVPQHVFLMDTTIAENIAFGEAADAIDGERLNRAVAMAGLADVVDALPQGLATRTGERGVRLSGGQRQRLGIARALYRDPRVLVMDEATSALDNATEAQVMTAIDRARAGRTFVIVAHRLDTVKRCDVIHVLEDGRLAASGSFETLRATSSSFRRIAKLDAPPVAAR